MTSQKTLHQDLKSLLQGIGNVSVEMPGPLFSQHFPFSYFLRVLKDDSPSSSWGHTISLTFLLLSVSGGPYVLSGHFSETAVSCNSCSPVFGQIRAALFVHTSCVPIHAGKSSEEYNYMLPPPGARHSRQFINRETCIHAPIQTLGLCL